MHEASGVDYRGGNYQGGALLEGQWSSDLKGFHSLEATVRRARPFRLYIVTSKRPEQIKSTSIEGPGKSLQAWRKQGTRVGLLRLTEH